jgi:MSHA biogenesis protein MshP
MSTLPACCSRSRGFALIAALFLLVVVAALGTFSVRVYMSQQSNADLELAGARADAALQAGIQYAAARLLSGNGCNSLTNPLTLPQNFTVTFLGCGTVPVANTPPVTVFSIQVTATHGQYGTPDFVSRQRIVRIL